MFAYSYTLENLGGAPIFFAHAHTVTKLCHDVTIDLPAGGLLPGQSVSFETQSICLVDSILVSYSAPWDNHTPWLMVLAPPKFDPMHPVRSAFSIPTTPPLYPPPWNNSVGVASGTFVVTPGAICYSSGILDFFKHVKKNTIDWLTKQFVNAAAPLLPNWAGGCVPTREAACWQKATLAIYDLFVTAAGPSEISSFLALQSTAWAIYSKMGYTKILTPAVRMKIDELSRAAPQSLKWEDIDPNLMRDSAQHMASTVGCGWRW